MLSLQGLGRPFWKWRRRLILEGSKEHEQYRGSSNFTWRKNKKLNKSKKLVRNPLEGFENLFGSTQPPETRLSQILGDVEKRAISAVKKGEILVFGHTHHPFINEAEDVVNAGCWATDSTVHNTVVELSGGKSKLSVFVGNEITERAKW